MSTKFERIETLKKEVTNTYQEKGMAKEWFDFKIKLKKSVHEYLPTELKETVLKNFITHFRKLLGQAETIGDVIKLGENVSFGQSKVHITPLFLEAAEPNEQLRKERIVELLASFFKRKIDDSNRKTIKEKHWPIQVERQYFKGDLIKETGYSFPKDTFPQSVFKNLYRLRAVRDMKNERVLDLATVLAESFFINSIEKFALANDEWLRYAAAQKFLKHPEGQVLLLPTDDIYRVDLIDTLKKYHLFPTNVSIRESKSVNENYRDAFYLPVKEGMIEKASLPEFYGIVLPELLYQMKYIKDKTKRRMEQTSDYARSFQTKKHINKSTEKAMKHNSFLNNFGFVELDNNADLSLFNKLQAEFKEFSKKVYIPIVKDHSFRIKRLGKHKANGLYYPAPVNATIFDVEHPDSFLHEVTHMIDHTFRKDGTLLSETLEFQRILDLYTKAVTKTVKAMDAEDPFRIQWEGTTKFNRNYYLQPVEVFARSYEVHLFENRGIRSSFLKGNYDGAIYPKDETYLLALAEYFDELFSFFEAEEELISKDSNEDSNESMVGPNVILDVDEWNQGEYHLGRQFSIF